MSACPACLFADGIENILILEPQDNRVVCQACGWFDSSDLQLETIGRTTDDGNHLFGRTEIDPSLLRSAQVRGIDAARAKILYTQANLRECKDRIAAACRSMSLQHKVDRCFSLFQTAHQAMGFSFGSLASPYIAATIWLVADEEKAAISIVELCRLLDTKQVAVARRKMQMRKFSSLKLESSPEARIPAELMDVILDYLTYRSNPSANAESTFPSATTLSASNAAFLKQAMLPSKSTDIRKLTTTLAARFAARYPLTTEAPFACACILFCTEAIMRKAVPQHANMIDVLAEIADGYRPWTLLERYRELWRWARQVYLDLPWISSERKEAIEGEDEYLGNAAHQQKLIHNKKGGRSKKLVGSKPSKTKEKLAPYYEEILRYRSAPSYALVALVDRQDAVPVQEDPESFLLRPIERFKRKSKVVNRKPLVDAAALKVVNCHAIKRKRSTAKPDQDTRHYLRLLLSGENAAVIATSKASLYDAGNPRRARIAKAMSEALSEGKDAAIPDDELFSDDEMDSYIRSGSELTMREKEAKESGWLAEVDKWQSYRAEKDELALAAQVRKRIKLEASQRRRNRLPAPRPPPRQEDAQDMPAWDQYEDVEREYVLDEAPFDTSVPENNDYNQALDPVKQILASGARFDRVRRMLRDDI